VPALQPLAWLGAAALCPGLATGVFCCLPAYWPACRPAGRPASRPRRTWKGGAVFHLLPLLLHTFLPLHLEASLLHSFLLSPSLEQLLLWGFACGPLDLLCLLPAGGNRDRDACCPSELPLRRSLLALLLCCTRGLLAFAVCNSAQARGLGWSRADVGQAWKGDLTSTAGRRADQSPGWVVSQISARLSSLPAMLWCIIAARAGRLKAPWPDMCCLCALNLYRHGWRRSMGSALAGLW